MRRQHKPVRSWWAPWRRRCACGVRWWPCPDGVTPAGMPVPETLAAYQFPEQPAPGGDPTLFGLPVLRNRGDR